MLSYIDRKGTLDDEAIFGPVVDYQCACGKYSGRQFADAICDICGVKITSRAARSMRFGHINLAVPLRHDICGGTSDIESLPVLPANVRASRSGARLNNLYETVLHASDNRNAVALHDAYLQLCALLAPIIVAAMDWSLPDAKLLAKGIGLLLPD
jgi:hypothetical protein